MVRLPAPLAERRDPPDGGAPQPRPAARRALVLALAGALLLAGAATWVWRFDPELSFYGDDDATYLILGKALSDGRGYRMITDPLEPPNTIYPPGYPLLIAGITRALGTPAIRDLLFPAKLLSFVLYLLSVVLFFLLERRREGVVIALAATAIFALHPEILQLAGEVMSEIPFLFFSLLGIVAFDRLVLAGGGKRDWRWIRWLVAAVLLTWPVYIRTIGVSMPFGAVLLLGWRRRIREAVMLGVAAAILLVPLALHTQSVSGPGLHGTYLQHFAAEDRPSAAATSSELTARARPLAGPQAVVTAVLQRLHVGFWFYRRAVPTAAVYGGPGDTMTIPVPVALLGLVLIVSGYFWRLRAAPGLAEVYLPLYMGVLLLWPYRSTRYFIPVLPFFILYAVKGLAFWFEATARWARPAARTAALVSGMVLATSVALGFAYQRHALEAAVAGRPLEGRAWAAWIGGYMRATVWIARNAPPEAVVYCLRPRHLSVVTGRQAGTYLVAPPEVLVERIRSQHVAYIIEDVTPFSRQHLRPALEDLLRVGTARLVHEGAPGDGTRIWLVRGKADRKLGEASRHSMGEGT